MKKFKKLSTLIIACAIALSSTGCGNNSESSVANESVANESSLSSEEASKDLSEEESSDENIYTGPVFESAELKFGETISGSKELQKPYKEKVTSTAGKEELPNANISMNFKSEFYGHDSAIDRDLVQYGWNFTTCELSSNISPDKYFIGEFTGDTYGDLVFYEDGVLTIRPMDVTTKRSYQYNGTIYESVYGDENSKYKFSKGITYNVPLNEATLCGTGDFDGNGFLDFLFAEKSGTVVIGFSSEKGITTATAGKFNRNVEKLFCGEVNGDGLCDLIMIDGQSVCSILNTKNGFTVGETTTLPFKNDYVFITVGDINNDRYADVSWVTKNGSKRKIVTMFGRGDGFFGPKPDVEGEGVSNTNLYAISEAVTNSSLVYFAVGDVNGDRVGDLIYSVEKDNKKELHIGLNMLGDGGAYDYSLFGMVDENGAYRMYAGGRWFDKSDAVANSLIGFGTGDGDHVMLYTSKDGITWDRYLSRPMFYLGIEQGKDGWDKIGSGWWTGNTLEPEVVYVDGVYHMLLQSSGTTQSGWYGDYINYASSTDGVNFTRKIDSPVIIPSEGKDFTQFKEIYGYEIGFNHHELVYIADDPEGKCFHLYTGHFINNVFSGYVRIRSADPSRFYWDDREATNGFIQIGNQIGYISNYDGKGNRLYLRITFTDFEDENGKRTVPTLQYSNDGINFFATNINLASVDVSDPLTEKNQNVYFLGFCTINGTGEIEKNEDGSYKLVYLATTSQTPVAPEIFGAEAGVGVFNFTLE